MKRILVTGGAGFIGANFIRYLFDMDGNLEVVNLDALTYAGNKANLDGVSSKSSYRFVHGDICDEELVGELFRTYQFDTVIHFAAESHVDRSIFGPSAFIKSNIWGTFVLLEAARKSWVEDFSCKRFHHVSTDEVFGSLSKTEPAFTEATPYDPRSPYSASKASSDHLVRAYYHTYGMPVTISNCSNNYGPYQYPEKLIPVIILNCLDGKPIPVYGDGMQIRDWLYVTDHCDAIYQVVNRGNNGETYNIGGNNQPPNIEIVRTICKIMDNRLPKSEYFPHENLITFVTDRPGHDRRYAMDIRKIQSELGWEPKENLSSGLEKTVDWYLNNKKWISDIREKSVFKDWVDKNYQKR